MTLDVAALFREQESLLFGVSWRILRSREDARDVAQECFVKLLGEVQRGTAIRNPAAWLCRTAINLSINKCRQKPHPPAPAVTARAADAGEERQMLDAAIAALPEKQRVVFILRHEQGMPLAEIAETLGVATGTIGVHLTRALQALRDRLTPHFRDNP